MLVLEAPTQAVAEPCHLHYGQHHSFIILTRARQQLSHSVRLHFGFRTIFKDHVRQKQELSHVDVDRAAQSGDSNSLDSYWCGASMFTSLDAEVNLGRLMPCNTTRLSQGLGSSMYPRLVPLIWLPSVTCKSHSSMVKGHASNTGQCSGLCPMSFPNPELFRPS